MKNMKKILFCVVLAALSLIVCVFSTFNVASVSEALAGGAQANVIQNYLSEFLETDKADEEKIRNRRTPGSEAEYNAAMYLKSEMDEFGNFTAVTDASTVDGVETFEFTSDIDGNKQCSQNIIYRREAKLKTDKKIIICAHYDSKDIFEYVDNKVTSVLTDGLNDNAAAVATLLAIAKDINNQEIDNGYDVEIIFFGASTNSCAGSSYYMRGLSETDMRNIMLVINLDKIALGKYNYFYVNEFITVQESYFANILSNIDGFKQLNTSYVIKYEKENPTGLNYVHVGLESDNVIFMAKNINTLNLLSGDYEGFRLQDTEYGQKENVTYTKNDTYSYVVSNYKNFTENLVNVSNGVMRIISDDDFVATMQLNNQLEGKYAFWTNERLAGFLTVLTFILCVFVFFVTYIVLKRKSKKRVTDAGLEQLIIKIAKNIGEDDNIQDFIDEQIKDDVNKQDDKKNKDE